MHHHPFGAHKNGFSTQTSSSSLGGGVGVGSVALSVIVAIGEGSVHEGVARLGSPVHVSKQLFLR